MPVYLRKKEKVLFVHIPKTGGSSFEEVMKIRGWREELKVSGLSLGEIDFMRVSPQHYHARILERLLNLEKFDRILTIVRSPFDRFKSEFYWQNQQGMCSFSPSDWILRMFDEYQTDPCIYDNHIRLQSDFIVEGCGIFPLEHSGVQNALEFCDSVGSTARKIFRRSTVRPNANKAKVSRKKIQIEEEFEASRPLIEEFYAKDVELYRQAVV